MELTEVDFIGLNISKNKTSGKLELDMSKLLGDNSELFEKIVFNPSLFLKLLKDHNTLFGNEEVSLINLPAFISRRISDLRAEDINKLIRVSGILKKVTQPTSKVEVVSFECTNCGTIVQLEQHETKIYSPTFCKACQKRNRYKPIGETITDLQLMELEENMEEIGSKQPHKLPLVLEG